MGYTPELQRFAADRCYPPPDDQYLTKKYLKNCFRNYMKAYIDLYNYNWFMSDWYGPFTESLLEGFQAGREFFAVYLDRKEPYLWYHYFQLHYWKQFVKKLIGRN